MVQAARAIKAPTFQRFIPQEAPPFLLRLERVMKYLDSALMQLHLNFSEAASRGRNWQNITNNIMQLDFSGITEIRNFDDIMREIDSRTEGRILDETDIIIKELYREVKKEELPDGFSLIGFLKAPTKPTEEECYEAEASFDPIEVIIRTFGIVDNIIDMGKKYNLPQKYWTELEDRFTKGYTFLRAVNILSKKV